jgi:hypothetical protein
LPTEADERNDRLDGECRALGRYLLGQEPNEYVRSKYRAAHARLGLDAPRPQFDSLLLGMAVRRRRLTRACDVYARFFAAQGTLRKKMVVLLAIAESTPPYFRSIDAADSGGRAAFFLRVMGKGAASVLCLLAALPFLLPLQLLLQVAGGRRPPGGAHGG